MQTKILIVAVVQNENGDVLMRKKPDGSPPYTETWYIFGAELVPGQPIDETLRAHIAKQSGIETRVTKELGWDTEIKQDVDGELKQFVYLDVQCAYIGGEIRPAVGIEKIEWVPKHLLNDYDIVPPSRVLFQKLDYLS